MNSSKVSPEPVIGSVPQPANKMTDKVKSWFTYKNMIIGMIVIIFILYVASLINDMANPPPAPVTNSTTYMITPDGTSTPTNTASSSVTTTTTTS